MNSPQFTRWRAFNRIYPTIERRIDIAAALITAAARAFATGEFDPNEYLQDYARPFRDDADEEEGLPDPDEVAAKLDRMFGAMAARAKVDQQQAAAAPALATGN